MAVHLAIVLILTGLAGIHSITTVSEVSVKAGKSITIPCLYGSQYRNHVKYLCQGYHWSSCSYAVKTNQRNSGKFSISDDKNQRIFTVTIRDLTDKDTDYWCIVEINGRSDVGEYFHLSVTRGTPSLYVDDWEITGFIGEKITIKCYHRNSGEMKWCRLGSSCVTGSPGSIDGTRVTIYEKAGVFTVTMSELRIESSGWYLCVRGVFQMPVHVTVTEKPTTTTLATTRRLTTLSPTSLVNPTAVSEHQSPTTAQREQQSSSVDLKTFIIPLSLLIFIVMMTLFIWLVLKKHKRTKAAAAAAMTEVEEEVTYSTVKHKRKASTLRSYTESDVDVLYSSVVTMREQRVPRVEANDENVTYSMLT